MCVKSKGRWTWYSCSRGTAAVTVAAKGGVLTLKFKVNCRSYTAVHELYQIYVGQHNTGVNNLQYMLRIINHKYEFYIDSFTFSPRGFNSSL